MATGEDLVPAVGTPLKLNTHNCKRCGQPIRRSQDFLRAHLWGHCAFWHWRCFIAAMRESDTHTAEIIQTGVTPAQPAIRNEGERMKCRNLAKIIGKHLVAATPWILLCGGAALASNTSGTPIDGPMGTWGTVITGPVAYGAIGTGGAGILTHFLTGREFHQALHYGMGLIAGGVVCTQLPGWAGSFTMSAAAVIQPVAQITSHVARALVG